GHGYVPIAPGGVLPRPQGSTRAGDPRWTAVRRDVVPAPLDEEGPRPRIRSRRRQGRRLDRAVRKEPIQGLREGEGREGDASVSRRRGRLEEVSELHVRGRADVRVRQNGPT